jgi:hypothetical protein
MGNLNTRQTAKDLLGDSQLAYPNNSVTINTLINNLHFGLDSANGTLFRASVLLHEVEIWLPC